MTPDPLVPVLLGKGGASGKGWSNAQEFLLCPKAYQFSVVRGIHEPVVQTPDYFAVGSLVHAGRARWFANRFDTGQATWKQIQDTVAEEAASFKYPVSKEAERSALHLLQEYVDYWSRRPLPSPVAAEYLLGPSTLFDGDGPEQERTSRLDDVSRYPESGGALAIGECKTTSGSPNEVFQQYSLHGQPLLQVLLWNRSPQGAATYGPISGYVIDAVCKPSRAGGKPTFARQYFPVTQHTLDWYAQSMRGYLAAMALVDWNTEVPRNVQNCMRRAGKAWVQCPYRDLCAHGRNAGSKYVYGAGDKNLLDWKPTDGEETAPWL